MAAVTKIALIAGGAPVHVTVADQQGDPLPPANVTWTGEPQGLTITPDATGFLFQADAGVPAGAVTAQASYQGPLAAMAVTASLTLDVSVGVTALEFFSP